MNLGVHFIRARSSLILSCSYGPFLLYYATEKRRELWIRGGEENWSVFNNWENGFPYFIYVIAIISI